MEEEYVEIGKINRELLYKKYVYNEKIRNYIFSRYDNILFNYIIKQFAKIIL